MNIRLNTDREDFCDKWTEAEISVEITPQKSLHFQFDDALTAAQAVQHFWLLGDAYERIIADLEKENAALVDDLAAAQKK